MEQRGGRTKAAKADRNPDGCSTKWGELPDASLLSEVGVGVLRLRRGFTS